MLKIIITWANNRFSYYFCASMISMKGKLFIVFGLLLSSVAAFAQQELTTEIGGYRVPATIYKNDTIPFLRLPDVYIFKPIVFRSKSAQAKYNKLVRDVKKTLPIAKEIKGIVIETYEYIQTLPTQKERDKHLKRVEKNIKKEYTPRMKRLTLTQGKLLIKLVYRETNSSSYDLVKAFLGSVRAWSYQVFASIFGANLKKQYDPSGDDRLIERVVLQVENGQL